MRTARTVRFLFTRLLLPALAFVVVAVVWAQKSGTESSYRYDDSGSLVKTETTYKEGHVVEKKEFDKAGKLRKRTTYTYLKGFKDPNTSTTEYAPDGETPKSTTNVDHDKDGSPTSTVTTNYDGAGDETSGSKRERDAVTAKERCYNWNAATQVYEEIECPKLYVSQVSMNSFVPQGGAATANVRTAGGLTVVTFVVKPGIVRVNLPDDMRAGDTISGTVSAEPNGNSKEEQTANRTELKKLGIQLIGSQANKPEDVGIGDVSTIFKYSLINDRESGNVFTVGLMLVGGQTLTKVNVPLTPSGAVITPDPKITAPTTASGAVITPDPKITQPDTIPSGEPLPPGQRMTPPASLPLDPKYFDLPLLGQTGRPMLIRGPFDGDSDNTKLTIGAKPAEVLAESPRSIVVASPSNISGPIEIAVKEGDKETKGSYRNVGVNLSAPKTSLLKGEKTELRVEVNGLQGLKQPVPLTLTYGGVIVMEGGPYQPLLIQPSQVGADGRYTTTRGITGVETGGWTATATVVTSRFDFCLQDDSVPARVVLWNTFTGDYSFTCPGCFPRGQPGGTTGETGGAKTGGATESGGTTTSAGPAGAGGTNPVPPTGLTGTGTMVRKGCIITLTHNAPDRRIFSRLDVCTNSGSSTVEVPKTNAKFTITDRNMADNTCPAR